ncbi:HPr kinase/phosphorylase [Kordiimonas marina]|uniref:HPr kinase/phosphorylase n=1 Tax=Kordiimonas marina TaxID=2872312 RepID=UPI001FF12B3E|nr:HPr kinase/phosphatase C-terminal domain-containing protein [Kordiimonas marina]MCJ9428306.1 HPr kinase/phosphatase C-terminal domain-containing protein [Kordiimonas marina]
MSGLPSLHGTVIARSGAGILLIGPSGAGKSDLALRLIDRGAQLVADDQVLVEVRDGLIHATPPARLAGLMEIRGLGIVPMPYVHDIPLSLVVELAAASDVPRLPEKQQFSLCGVDLPLVRLNAFEVSTPNKIELALTHPEWIASEGDNDRDTDS